MKPEAQASNLSLFSIASPLPTDGSAPEWIVVFPKLGRIEARDGRKFVVDGDALLAAFRADAIDLPVDEMHQTDTALATGGVAPAVGWINDMRIRDGALEVRADWLDAGKALLAAKSYRYTSPSFFHGASGRATRLKAVALVTSPALGNQPALAAANTSSEISMKLIATALGLTEDANEAACLAALNTRLAQMSPKAALDEAVANLAAANTKLAALEAEQRNAKITALIEGALAAKKIIPAEKDHYVALCATDDGFATVEKLFGFKTPLLAGSGLDSQRQPDEGAPLKAAQLAAKATDLVDKARAAGRTLNYADAMAQVVYGGNA